MMTQPKPYPSTAPPAEVISLEPRRTADGETFWSAPAQPVSRGAGVELRRALDGQLVRIDDTGDASPVSRLPRGRMAGDDPWADVIQAMGDNERRPDTPGKDVIMAPGGQMHVTSSDRHSQPLSVVPKVRMAAFGSNPDPDPHEARDVMVIDPARVEGWQPVRTRALSGWQFHLTPEPGAPRFEFLAFRSPADRNQFRVYVVSPNADNLYGHVPHMISVVVGGQNIPVICGPRGEPARDLATARGHAGKWMLYTYQRVMRGARPGFSE